MPTAGKTFVQGYNAQVAVESEHQIIVAEAVLQTTNDTRQLMPMVEAVCDALGTVPEAVSADAGYWVGEAIERLEDDAIEAYLAPEKIRHREWREAKPPTEPFPEGAAVRDRMRYKLRTEHGRAEYNKWKVTAEPVIGQRKDVVGIRRFLHRGLGNVRSEWRLACTAHNLLKVWRAIRSAGAADRGIALGRGLQARGIAAGA